MKQHSEPCSRHSTPRHVSLRRQLARLALVLGVLVTSLTTISVPAALATSGCSTAKNLQVGWSTSFWHNPEPMSYEGAGANITDRSGYVLCTTDSNPGVNFVTSWVMIFGNNGLAQSGAMYRWGYGSCVHRWAEQVSPSGVQVDKDLGGCSAPGETHHYWEQSYYTGSAWVMRSNIDSTNIMQSAFSPYSWGGSLQPEFSSEAYHYESQIPGSAASPEDWNGMQVQNLSNDNWYGTCGNANMGNYNGNANDWGQGAPHCDHITAWQSYNR